MKIDEVYDAGILRQLLPLTLMLSLLEERKTLKTIKSLTIL